MAFYPREIPVMSRWRKLYLDIRIWLGLKLFKQPESMVPELFDRPCVVNLGFGQILKAHSSYNEVMVLDWLRACSELPVPRVIGAYYRRGDYTRPITEDDPVHCCLIMERVPAETLHQAWDKMTSTDKSSILNQLERLISHLRSFKQPTHIEGHVCSFIQGPMDEPALSNFNAVGPFTIPQFIDYLMKAAIRDRESKEERFRHILSRTLEGDEEPNRLYLTHGDLHTRNIMVKKVGKDKSGRRRGEWVVSGLIDWTMAGWYPIYWETYKAGYTPHDRTVWRKLCPLAFGNLPEEVAVLQELQSITFR
ncbi:hypothetical protein P389DRAFT_211413 [Cystobasidium minutum MCA 4210]|uniref:uncharacterized protein n=1 Tax=Cystobasidium minutum MCA 4210 TaxID=1397322 RepID=UPI0034CF0914|eukprot:jgi/Rhomi1/211413/estExt_Genemark1.C_4_t30091